MIEQDILTELEAYASARKLSPATVTSRAVQNSRLYAHLKAGGDCTTRIVARLRAYMAANPANSDVAAAGQPIDAAVPAASWVEDTSSAP
jgi:hypothetical protein